MGSKRNKKQSLDFRSLPPEQRPAVGEKVTIKSGPLAGRTGIVTVTMRVNRVLVVIPFCGRKAEIRLGRENVLDEDGKEMPKYYTEEEKKDQIEQFRRLESAMGERRLHDYLKYKMDIHSETREKLKKGEASLIEYFDEDIFEGIGIGIEWILYGDEKCKEHPCGAQMKKYLNSHPERREQVWKWMQEDGCAVKDYFYDCEEDDWYEEEEYEDFEDELNEG